MNDNNLSPLSFEIKITNEEWTKKNNDNDNDNDNKELMFLTMNSLVSPTLLNKISINSQKSEIDLITYRDEIETLIQTLFNNKNTDSIHNMIIESFYDFINVCNRHYYLSNKVKLQNHPHIDSSSSSSSSSSSFAKIHNHTMEPFLSLGNINNKT
jgi:hypothetical protein